MKWFCCIWIMAFFAGGLSAEDVAELRMKRDDLVGRGMWQDALLLYQDRLMAVADARSDDDLGSAVTCLESLNAWSALDDMVEDAVASHANDAGLLVRAAEIYQSAPHQGRLIGGEFERGGGPSGARRSMGGDVESSGTAGQSVHTAFRDFVRSMQLARRAIDSDGSEQERWHAWDLIASMIQERDSWNLQILTSLDQLPGWGELGPEGGTEGAPWDKDRPVVYGLPDSWIAATNDGERWRFALAEQARLKPRTIASGILARAGFAYSQFGTEMLSSQGWRKPQDPDAAKGIFETETLADDECLTKTSDGIRRFKLPAEFHFIALYQSILDDDALGGDAGDRLAEVFLDRGQYDSAKEVLEKTIGRHGAGGEDARKRLLDQITGNWGRFEPAAVCANGSRPKLPLVFRNASRVQLSAAPVDMDSVIDDTMNYLKNTGELNWERINPGSIAGRLIQDQGTKYLGPIAVKWNADLKPRDRHRDTRCDIELPLDQSGAWWISATLPDGNTFHTLAWIVDSVLLEKNFADAKQWWLADAVDGSPVKGVEIEFFGYRSIGLEHRNSKGHRFEVRTKQFKRITDEDGRVLLKPSECDPAMQWMAVAHRKGQPPAFSAFQSIFFEGAGQVDGSRDLSYAVSDRPLYKPGDRVHLKYYFRNVGYYEPTEEAFSNKEGTLVVSDGRGDEVIKIEKLKTDAIGVVESELIIPKDGVLGNWTASFRIGNRVTSAVSFRVEEYRKPEYEVKVESPSDPVKLGGKFTATVVANYFHGLPVRNAVVDVTVKRGSIGDRWFPCGRWDWLYGRGAWWTGSQAEWHPAWQSWGCISPMPPWWGQDRWTPDELVFKRRLSIGPDGKAMVEIDTSTAKVVHGDLDAKYTIEARVVDASRREERGTGTVLVARKPFEIVVWLDRGHARSGDDLVANVSAANLSGKPVSEAKGELTLFLLTSGDGGRIEERKVTSFPVVMNAQGEIQHRFAAPTMGQYRLAVSLTSQGGDRVEGGAILNIHGTGRTEPTDWHFGPLEIIADKADYIAGESARLRVNSDHKDAHVWMFQKSTDANGRDARRIQLDGKSLEVELPLNQRDMPNAFIEAVMVHDAKVYTAVRQIQLPPVSQVLDVALEPTKNRVRPQEESSLRVTVSDVTGKPFVGKIALTIYDKSLESITGGSNVAPIHEIFWGWKNYYSQTVRDFMPNPIGNLQKPNTIGMEALGVSGIEKSRGMNMFAGASGARMAKGSVVLAEGAMSMTMQDRESDVMANPSIAVRSEFADLLKWSGNIETDSKGSAEISLKFPDNLTTWKARVWAMGEGTRVGEGTAEIITSKELLVRLQAPRFMVERDVAVLSAVIQNEHDASKSVTVSLELEGKAIEGITGSSQTIQIAGHGEKRIDWRVKAVHEGEAIVRVRADAGDDGDAVQQKIPVTVHGMLRQEAWSRVVAPNEPSATIQIDVPRERRPELSKLTIRFSPSVAAAVVDTIPYLANYSNGCTEQTLNRFVPMMIARNLLQRLKVNLAEIRAMRTSLNPQELGDNDAALEQRKQWKANPVFDEVEMERMTAQGIQRLADMQNSDGGWGWFSGFGETSYPHTSAVVVHGLFMAKSLGAKVPDAVLEAGIDWLAAYENAQVNALKYHVEREAQRATGKAPRYSNKPDKSKCDSIDAFVRQVLGAAHRESEAMVGFLYRDRIQLPVYAICLVGLELMRKGDMVRRDEVMQMIRQFIKHDAENQTSHLDLGISNQWWMWHGSEVEANAWYLKLLAATNPNSAEARGLVKYLVNQRRFGSSWKSTRESAYAIEAIGDYLIASGEDAPEMEVEILMDGRSLRREVIRKDNLFSLNDTVTLRGDGLKEGKHVVELKKSGKGTLYGSAFLEVFSKVDRLRPAGLEIKVSRRLFQLVPVASETHVPDSSGKIAIQQTERFKRKLLQDGDRLMSGDRVEVELVIDSKNDYEYLIFSDAKAAGFEALDSLSGYVPISDGVIAYRESRERSVDFFVRSLQRGKSVVSYQLRAETLGKYQALPTTIEAMYAPELKGNSDDLQLEISNELVD